MEIDLKGIATAKELHQRFKKELGFPDFYGNNWDALWDAITGLVEMPEILILNNWYSFANNAPETAKPLAAIIDRYNETEGYGKIIYQ